MRASVGQPTHRWSWPADYLGWFIPAMALQFAMVASHRRPARHR